MKRYVGHLFLISGVALSCNGLPKKKSDIPGQDTKVGPDNIEEVKGPDTSLDSFITRPETPENKGVPVTGEVSGTEVTESTGTEVPEELDEEVIRKWATDLPIMHVKLSTETVLGQEYVPSTFEIITNADQSAKLDSSADEFVASTIRLNDYITEESPKPSLRAETINEEGKDEDVPLLGLPADSDWYFNASYYDKTFIRDTLAYSLYAQMGHYAPRSTPVELTIKDDANTTYQGVYLLTEKIKRSKSRVDIQNLKKKHDDEPNISGGYILQFDSFTENDTIMTSTVSRAIKFSDPDKPTEAQWNWIQNHFRSIEATIKSATDLSAIEAVIDGDSFVDYILIIELAKKPGAYELETYIIKDREAKLAAGPVWNFSLGFGNYIADTQGWSVEGDSVPYLYAGLFANEEFKAKLAARWQELRADLLNNSNLNTLIDNLSSQVATGIVNNFKVWKIDESDNRSAEYIDQKNQENIALLKDWLTKRVSWMDSQL